MFVKPLQVGDEWRCGGKATTDIKRFEFIEYL